MSDGPGLALFSDRARLGAWRVAHAAGGLRGTLHLKLARDDGAWVRCIVGAKGEQALVQTRAGSVYYKDFHGCADGEAAQAARTLATALDDGSLPLAVLFPHLAMHATPTAEDRKLLGATLRAQPLLLGAGGEPSLPEARASLYFDPPGVAEFLAPEVTPGGAPVAGCTLQAIYLPAVGRRQAVEFNSLVLEFSRGDELARLRLSVGGREGFGRVGSALSLDVLGVTGEVEGMSLATTSLASWLLTLLRLKGADDLAVTVPTRAEELRALSVPADRAPPGVAPAGPVGDAGEGPPPALNLAIDSDCHQACAFCSVKSYVKPSDGGADELSNVRFQLRSARERGVQEVRLNGIDPLTFSRVLDVVSAVKELGFRRLTVYSSCRRLADDAFRAEFLRRAPEELTVTVPLYGVSAKTHDRVVGAPGAYLEARRAFDALLEVARRNPRVKVHASTVVVTHNVGELAALAAFAREREVELHPHVPYPMRQTTRDPYADSVVRESEIVSTFLGDLGRFTRHADRAWALNLLGLAVLHPCLLVREERTRGLPVFGAGDQDRRPMLPGTEYRAAARFVHDSGGAATADDAFAVSTVPCPHAERCALAPMCPAEHYAVYQQRFGLDEYEPVSPRALYGLRKG
jgi:molybdenum cofactor biosynthesis enzyme MoaA